MAAETVSTLSAVCRKRGRCKGIPFLPRLREWGRKGLKAEITRGKGRSVALCPLAEFYSKCVYLQLTIDVACRVRVTVRGV